MGVTSDATPVTDKKTSQIVYFLPADALASVLIEIARRIFPGPVLDPVTF